MRRSNNFRNLYTGLGYLASACIMLGTLGFKSAPRVKVTPLPLYMESRGRRIDDKIDRFFTRREYNRVTFRINPLGGRYKTREGFSVLVRPNTEGFYDKLPFVVEGGRPTNKYTVCERGWSYPGNDKQGGFFKIGLDVVEEE